jgi:hypothetical protein
MNLTLREGYLIKCCVKLITVISHNNYYSQFCHHFCERIQSHHPSIDKANFPFRNRINEFVGRRKSYLTSCLNEFCRNLNITCRFKLLQLFNSNFNLKTTGTSCCGFNCIYFFLPNITDIMHI